MVKKEILKNICYTELVFERINKKMDRQQSKVAIQKMIYRLIEETSEKHIQKIGKNFYISNLQNALRVTVNAGNFRVITVDVIKTKVITKS